MVQFEFKKVVIFNSNNLIEIRNDFQVKFQDLFSKSEYPTKGEQMNKEKNKRKVIFLLVSLFLLTFSLSMISAFAPVLISPNSTTTAYTGSVTFNVTNGTGTDAVINMNVCTVWALSTSTANSTYVKVNSTNATNFSVSANNITSTFNTAIFEDASDYSFYASCFNESGQYNSSVNTLIILDNTVPTTPSSLSPASGTSDTDGTLNFSATVNNPTTTSCRLYFPKSNPGDPSYSMSYTGTVCYYNIANIPTETFDYTIQASDERNKTNSTQTTFDIRPSTSGSYMFNEKTSQQVSQNADGTLTITSGNELLGIPVWIVVVVVIVIVGIVIYSRRK